MSEKRVLKLPAGKADDRVTVRFVVTDEVNEDDTILILSPEELRALIRNYEAGATTRLRAKLQYFRKNPNAKKRVDLYLPTELRVHKDGNLEPLQ